jgi:cystine transport system permease protein
VVFSLSVGAYSSEIIRAAVLSIPKGQWEAASALSLNYRQTLTRIILPQAVKISIPPLFNSFISLVKDTSLASNITVTEMFLATQRITARTYEPLIMYVLLGFIYLIFCTILTWIQGKLEKKLILSSQSLKKGKPVELNKM